MFSRENFSADTQKLINFAVTNDVVSVLDLVEFVADYYKINYDEMNHIEENAEPLVDELLTFILEKSNPKEGAPKTHYHINCIIILMYCEIVGIK
jgi:hypothetical protein